MPVDDDRAVALLEILRCEDVCEDGMVIDSLVCVGCDCEVCIRRDGGTVIN
jgi:hypothetical protein